MKKLLIIIRGLSGSGKTTLADLIVRYNDNSGDVTADDFFLDEDDVYHFDFKKIKEAHSWCQEETKEMMEEGLEVIVVHNTFKQQWEAVPYFNLASQYSYDVQVVSLYDSGLSDEDLSKRCVHGLTTRQIGDQRAKWDLNIHPHRKNRPRYTPLPAHYQNDRRWRSKSVKGY
tara:strand:+ start:6032 stop:6547 length:516 start_codon:yes stop_codon:yes gene_type:complete